MSSHQKNRKPAPANTKIKGWDGVLDFGKEQEGENHSESTNVNQRLKKLVKDLQDINRRIDQLNYKY